MGTGRAWLGAGGHVKPVLEAEKHFAYCRRTLAKKSVTSGSIRDHIGRSEYLFYGVGSGTISGNNGRVVDPRTLQDDRTWGRRKLMQIQKECRAVRQDGSGSGARCERQEQNQRGIDVREMSIELAGTMQKWCQSSHILQGQ